MKTLHTLVALLVLGLLPGALAQEEPVEAPAADDPPALESPPEFVPPEEPPRPTWRDYAAAILAKYGAALLGLIALSAYLLNKRYRWTAPIKRAFRARIDLSKHLDRDEDDRTRTVPVREVDRVESGPDAGAPKPGIGEVRRGEDPHELIVTIREDPKFLRDALQDFCDQDDGAEQLRQFCESYTFAAKGEDDVDEIYLVPFTEDQLRKVPPDIMHETRSRSAQARLGAVVVVKTEPSTPAGGGAGGGRERRRTGPPPKEPLAPPRDTPKDGEGQ